jgi:hypothetical protein
MKTTQQIKKNLKRLVWEEVQIEKSQNSRLTSKVPPEKFFLGDFFFRKSFATRPKKDAS